MSNEKVNQSGRSKPSGSKLGIVICGGLFVVSLILSLVLDNLLGPLLFLVTGLIDLVVAFVMFNRAASVDLVTCPECGGQRVEECRKYIETTEKEKYFERVPHKNPDETIYFQKTYKHWYLAMYVCQKCGKTDEKKVSEYGGVYTIYYSGRVKDTSKRPVMFKEATK